jgi:hypothetical protein
MCSKRVFLGGGSFRAIFCITNQHYRLIQMTSPHN